eukprot:COSAG02_NODE_45_length_45811_cov_83.565891_14_plen_82_part_00
MHACSLTRNRARPVQSGVPIRNSYYSADLALIVMELRCVHAIKYEIVAEFSYLCAYRSPVTPIRAAGTLAATMVAHSAGGR